MSATQEQLEARARESRYLNAYARHTCDVLIPELERLAVPWRYLAWRKLHREIKRRNAYVNRELDRLDARR